MNRLLVLLCLLMLLLLFSVRSFNPATFTMSRDECKEVLSAFSVHSNQIFTGSESASDKEEVSHVGVLIPCQ